MSFKTIYCLYIRNRMISDICIYVTARLWYDHEGLSHNLTKPNQTNLTVSSWIDKTLIFWHFSKWLISKFDCYIYTKHGIIILNRGSMFAFQWREFSTDYRLFECYHSQWEIGDAAITREFPLSPHPPPPL